MLRYTLAFAVLAACATAGGRSALPATTFIPSVTPQQARDAIAGDVMGQGYTVKAANDYTLVVERRAGTTASLLFGTRLNPNAMYRITYSIAPGLGGVRVTATVGMVSNAGTGFERVTDMDSNEARESLQAQLDRIRVQITPRREAPDTSAAVARR